MSRGIFSVLERKTPCSIFKTTIVSAFVSHNEFLQIYAEHKNALGGIEESLAEARMDFGQCSGTIGTN